MSRRTPPPGRYVLTSFVRVVFIYVCALYYNTPITYVLVRIIIIIVIIMWGSTTVRFFHLFLFFHFNLNVLSCTVTAVRAHMMSIARNRRTRRRTNPIRVSIWRAHSTYRSQAACVYAITCNIHNIRITYVRQCTR